MRLSELPGSSGRWSTRRANEGDLESIIDLFLALEHEAGDPLTAEQVPAFTAALRRYLAAALPTGECVVWVATAAEAVVGCAALIIYRAIPAPGNLDGQWGYVTRVYTSPTWRRHGIATALVRQLLAFAHDTGIRRVMLTATEAGKNAYERLGFRQFLGMMQVGYQRGDTSVCAPDADVPV